MGEHRVSEHLRYSLQTILEMDIQRALELVVWELGEGNKKDKEEDSKSEIHIASHENMRKSVTSAH